MKASTIAGLLVLAASASAKTITIKAGDDFEESCLMAVEPGDTCYLEKGEYKHDGITRVHGTKDKRITITGDPAACIKGSNTQDRVLQIAHDYYTVEGICFDGQHGNDNVATGIYVLGADRKSTKNGVTSSVTGLQMFDLEIKNFSSECVHFRYFVTHAEVSGCTIQHCGIDAFQKGKGSKVGEGIYLGTALSQVKDGKAPEPKIRSGGSDNVSADVCAYNWIHHNTFRTYGNECVDVKEGSTRNLIEHNVCEQQKDPDSGCFGSRGSENTFRWNEIAECKGAGVRVGGEKGYGGGNHIYGNTIKDAARAAFAIHAPKQGTVCENQISSSGSGLKGSTAFGSDYDQSQFSESVATGDCSSYPGDIGTGSSAPAPAPKEDTSPGSALTADDGLEAGVNYTDEASNTAPEIDVVETNDSAGSPGLGKCGTVLKVKKSSTFHPQYADKTTEISNLFDGGLDTYFSVNRESTQFTFELEEKTDVNGIAIGFFMKAASEERIQTFDVAVLEDDGKDWKTVLSRKESSGQMGNIQTFNFSSRKARYVRLETHGNTFNNWSAFTEIEICGKAGSESNALFGGIHAIDEEVEMLAGAVCLEPTKLTPVGVTSSGSDNVKVLFDRNFDTRWTTLNTDSDSDLSNDMVVLTFEGDMRVSTLKVAFFDGHLAHQYISVYVQSARAYKWTPVLLNEQAAKHEGLQTFNIDLDDVNKLYIVGKGNDVGQYSKFSEVEVYGC